MRKGSVNRWHGTVRLATALALAMPLSALSGAVQDRDDDGDRIDRVDRTDREDRTDRADRIDRADREERGDVQDRADKVLERASRDAARSAERTQRETAEYQEERAKILSENTDEPDKQQEELAKLDAERSEDIAKEQQEAAEEAEDIAEELEKAEAEDAEDAAEHAEDLADDLAEDLAESGSSETMRGLAQDEDPEFDHRGYPVRRGEVVALDLGQSDIARVAAAGYSVIAQTELPALGSSMVRLSVPDGTSANEALARVRAIVPGGVFDYTHYYRMQVTPAGGASGNAAQLPRRRQGNLQLGMIDTGVAAHDALKGVTLDIRDFATGRGATPTAHGTAVASILALEGTRTLHVANVFRSDGREPYTSADALASALEWLVGDGVQVINMSLSGPRNAILDRLVQQSVGRGTVIVAAAGNGGPSAPPAYPAALAPVVAVTAVDRDDRVYRYANQGRYITVAARGVNEPAADAGDGGVRLVSGTSFATPRIAAWMARCVEKAQPRACTRKLRDSARDVGAPGYDPVYGFGVVE